MRNLPRLAFFAAAAGLVAAIYARQANAPGAPAPTGGADILGAVAVNARRLTQGFMPRGIRNNNPGNIRHGTSKWQGLAVPPSDGAYCVFVESKFGLRALAKLLKNYQAAGFRTVRQIIDRWAPPKENQTYAYVSHVCEILNVGPDTVLTAADLPRLVGAIVRHENGFNPYTAAEIAEGIRLAT